MFGGGGYSIHLCRPKAYNLKRRQYLFMPFFNLTKWIALRFGNLTILIPMSLGVNQYWSETDQSTRFAASQTVKASRTRQDEC